MTDLELTEYFIDKFKAIPEEKWTTGIMDRGNQRCAMGHCSKDFTPEFTPAVSSNHSPKPSERYKISKTD